MVRKANKFDIPGIISLLYEFRDEYGVHAANFDNEDHVTMVLTACIHGGGLIYVAQDEDDEIVGFIAGMRSGVIWDPSTFILQELALYVLPSARSGSHGSSLLHSYLSEAIKMKEDGIIANFTMTILENTPNLRLEDYGMKKQETIYVGDV